jgi:hypothetical protein
VTGSRRSPTRDLKGDIVRTYRRIEITAFRHRVTITNGPLTSGPPGQVGLRDVETDEAIDPQSDDGRRLLTEAVSILMEQLSAQRKERSNEKGSDKTKRIVSKYSLMMKMSAALFAGILFGAAVYGFSFPGRLDQSFGSDERSTQRRHGNCLGPS